MNERIDDSLMFSSPQKIFMQDALRVAFWQAPTAGNFQKASVQRRVAENVCTAGRV
jgi:hypothetical protein